MEDFMSFKGHFTVQTIDAQNKIIDEYVENNMIMEVARTTMARILSQLNNGVTINNVRLGTDGHIGDTIVTPKTATEGFVKERNRLFSESVDIDDFQSIDLLKNDTVKYIGTQNGSGVQDTYYLYKGPNVNGTQVNNINFLDASLWTVLGLTAPYYYKIAFEPSGINDQDAINVVEDDVGSGSSVRVFQEDSSVTFTIDLVQDAANSGGGAGPGTSVFTEAALYSEDDIFAMKTFKAKIKDNTVLLRIIWTITF